MSSFLYRLGRGCATHRWRTVVIWIAVAIALISLNRTFGNDLVRGFEINGVDSEEAHTLLAEQFPTDSGARAQVVVQSPAGTLLADPPQADAIATLRAHLQAEPDIVAIDGLEPDAQSGGHHAVSADGTIGLITVRFDSELETSREFVDHLEEAGNAASDEFGREVLRVEYGGTLYLETNEPETGLGEAAGLLAAIIILLIAFGSLVAMSLPIGVAMFGIVVGLLGVMGLVAIGVPVPDWAPSMASMIGLGVGIDYVLFVVTRYREGLRTGLTVPDAIGRANATAGLAVIFAGGTVVIAILGLAMAGIPALTATSVAVSAIIALMVATSVTLLPALLGWVGDRIFPRRTRRDQAHRAALEQAAAQHAAATGEPHAGWQRWGTHVSTHAGKYFIGTLLLLVALSAPVLWIQLGFADQGNADPQTTHRQAYDLLAEGFGPGFNGPLLIAADTTGTNAAELETLAAAVAADPGIAAISPTHFSPVGQAATFTAFPTTTPQAAATFETLDRLRNEVLPAVLAQPDAVHVGGATSVFADVADRVGERLPYFITAVIVLSFVLLVLVFRSILVPLKAAILNLLSIGAAYGVLVAVFQWGWGLKLVGLAEPVPIVAIIPMMTFAVLFGLSMDYEVFLMTRIKEEYLASGDNGQSVISGIANTARVITSAALIMIAVFVGFVSNPDPLLKMLGLSLATAIAVDASIVRIVLVPASMRLFGDTNWWFPRWLEWLPRIDIEGEQSLPPREYVGSDVALGDVTANGAEQAESEQASTS